MVEKLLMKEIIVFRYGHRVVRDYRVTSHCALVSRAFGAKKIIICGEEDNSIKNSIDNVKNQWGGDFETEFTTNWEKKLEEIKKQNYCLIHLTMYGEPIQKIENKITNNKICLIIGSQKVDAKIYEIADYNVAITSQPHSEIAALSVALDRLFGGQELLLDFSSKKKQIIPQKKGKKVIDLK